MLLISGVMALVAIVAGTKCPSTRPPGLNQVVIEVDGKERNFYVFIPDDMTMEPSPAIVSFHGCGSSPFKFEFESSMNVKANKNKWFNVYMEGTDDTGGTRLGWNAGYSTCNTKGAVNDVHFTQAVHTWMLENLCVETSAIFASGFSNGGSMIFNITCELPHFFAGFSFTGSTWPAAQYPDSDTCNGGIPLSAMKPVFGVCGSEDGCSSSIAPWYSRYSGLFECRDPSSEFELTPTTTCHRHEQCGDGGELAVEYCLISQLGHCWSGGDCCDEKCRSQSFNNPDASTLVIDFFKRVRQGQLQKNNATLSV
mmetsp:Transcript_146129/g.207125  ORF Transcript_146129/g.207125 Transcript_146129/m.207125 type:complete len:310 (+) Transcript_146129:62-991(+)